MTNPEQDKQFMREAIRLADESVRNGGGPFGAVIVKNNTIIANDIEPSKNAAFPHFVALKFAGSKIRFHNQEPKITAITTITPIATNPNLRVRSGFFLISSLLNFIFRHLLHCLNSPPYP